MRVRRGLSPGFCSVGRRGGVLGPNWHCCQSGRSTHPRGPAWKRNPRVRLIVGRPMNIFAVDHTIVQNNKGNDRVKKALSNGGGTAVALTSRWIAAARAHESARRDRLFDDPFAAALAGTEGLDSAGDGSPYLASTSFFDVLILRAIRAFGVPYVAIRTRFFDELLLRAVHPSGVRQVVIVAAGMDARAFRLPWPPGTFLYEMDHPEVLAAKDAVLAAAGAQATCQRHTLGVDLTHPSWSQALCDAGYDAQAPSVWLIEGLLMYLDDAAVYTLLGTVAELTVPGS